MRNEVKDIHVDFDSLQNLSEKVDVLNKIFVAAFNGFDMNIPSHDTAHWNIQYMGKDSAGRIRVIIHGVAWYGWPTSEHNYKKIYKKANALRDEMNTLFKPIAKIFFNFRSEYAFCVFNDGPGGLVGVESFFMEELYCKDI